VVAQWTHANDVALSPLATKPCMALPCDDTIHETYIYAITQCLKIGNFRERWFPEQVRAFQDLVAVWHARYAESLMLASITTGSKVITHGQVLGTSRDVFTALKQLFDGIRFRHRIPRSQRFRVIGLDWVRDNIIVDLIRTGESGDSVEERLVMAESRLESFFAASNANVTWTPDYQSGVAVGSPGGPFGGVQGVGPMIGFPSVARFWVFLEGSWLFVDGGQLDLGVIRDSTLVGTNDFIMFSETFENVHYHGLPAESYALDIDICADGSTSLGIDINPCVSGS
jgi:hypothetical protein